MINGARWYLENTGVCGRQGNIKLSPVRDLTAVFFLFYLTLAECHGKKGGQCHASALATFSTVRANFNFPIYKNLKWLVHGIKTIKVNICYLISTRGSQCCLWHLRSISNVACFWAMSPDAHKLEVQRLKLNNPKFKLSYYIVFGFLCHSVGK